MRKNLCIIIALICCLSATYAQSYKKVKVTLSNGFVIKGTNATIDYESISFTNGNLFKTYPMSDVLMVQAREGKAAKWALGCGAGCLAYEVIYGIARGTNGTDINGNPQSTGNYILGAILETAVGAGIGALIGTLTDREQIVYLKNNTSLLDRLQLNITTDRLTAQSPAINNLTLSYRF